LNARFCVKCGATNKPLVGSLCIDCFLEMYGLVKQKQGLEISICPRCYAIRLHGKWVRPNTYDEFVELVRSSISSSLAPSRPEVKIDSIRIPSVDLYSNRVPVVLRARIGDHSIEKQLELRVHWKKALCPMCFKRAAGSYQAVVQVRYVHETPDIERFKEKLTEVFPDDIVEIEELKHGFDVKVSSDHVARRIALLIQRTWKAVRIIESYGDQRRRRDGRRTARLYISVRILNVSPGDYVVIDRRAYEVESVTRDKIVLRDSSGRRRVLNIKELPRRASRP